MSDAPDHLALPVDAISAGRLAERGLHYRLLDTADEAAYAAWIRADERGFHGPASTDEQNAFSRVAMGSRRTTGVWDPQSVLIAEPVATVNSWPVELSVPGERTVGTWAISSVTVSPTHRRRGIARALLEGELRTAQRLGLPLAALTVSEATIYGRYGFGPATTAADWRIDTRAAGWVGDEPEGRVDFIPVEDYARVAYELHETARIQSPGEVDGWPQRWRQFAGLRPGDSDAAGVRAVQFREDGEVRAAAAFRIVEDPQRDEHSTVRVLHLDSTTPSARLGVLRFLLSLDLVARLDANLLSADEPLRWRLADQRAAEVTVRDHEWLRILDVPRALEARRFSGAGRWRLDVADELGFASGRWLVESDAEGGVRVGDAGHDEDAPLLRTDVATLGSLYLGGVGVRTLADAGRTAGSDAEAVAIADRVLHSAVPPFLSFWY
ncbi:GNAT family N-acetyltransferase [Schumannella luteola]|uniref:Putative acetyltransferase n=1 Tax=Schumannella luteola TaxID=472059 RepID=A0A852YR61_9MICO|nr:GNAT family N-acetyltransferase [Schumannella luteola]NYG99735.1 putative acetyltransferase [Schumannella luteola]TPX06514.1 GNAT family N-acetyltransferase [Schumannella luteola]